MRTGHRYFTTQTARNPIVCAVLRTAKPAFSKRKRRALPYRDVSRIFGLHVTAMAKPGHIYIVKGPDSAAVDRFTVTLTGKGCHAAHPNMGADPIVAAAGLIPLFQTVVSRNVNPFDPAVVSVTHVQAGDTWNVIPAVARMEGIVRTLKPDTRRFIRYRLAEICAVARQSLGAGAVTMDGGRRRRAVKHAASMALQANLGIPCDPSPAGWSSPASRARCALP